MLYFQLIQEQKNKEASEINFCFLEKVALVNLGIFSFHLKYVGT